MDGSEVSSVPEGFVPDGFEPDSSAAPIPASSGQQFAGTQMIGPRMARMGMRIAPYLGAAGAVALAPETGGTSILGSRLLASLLPRAIAAYGGGAAGRMAENAGAGMAGFSAPQGVGPSLKSAHEAGLEQAGLETVGGLGAAGLKAGGGAMLEGAYRVAPGLAEKFPRIFEAISRERIPVGSKATRQGSAEASKRMRASAAKTSGLIDKANRTFTAADLAGDALDNLKNELGRAPTKDERTALIVQIRDRANELLSERTHGVGKLRPSFGGKKTLYSGREVKHCLLYTSPSPRDA